MRSEIQVHLRFQDIPIDPDELTSELGVEPTRIWRGGEGGKYAKSIKVNGWELSSLLDKSADLKAHVKALLETIEPVKNNFSTVSKKYPLDLECIVYIYEGDRPDLTFDQGTIRALAGVNTSIAVDLYVMD